MALLTKKGNVLPEGAVQVTKEEALKNQLALINDWPSVSEVSALRFGPYISALGGAISSSVIFMHFKKALNFGRRETILKMVPTVILTTVLSYRSTQKFCTEPIVLMSQTCPICIQAKLALSQCYVNLFLPSLIGALLLSPLMIPKRTGPVPNENEGLIFWKNSWKIFKSGSVKYQWLFAAQSILVLFLPYLQEKQLRNVMIKIRKGYITE